MEPFQGSGSFSGDSPAMPFPCASDAYRGLGVVVVVGADVFGQISVSKLSSLWRLIAAFFSVVQPHFVRGFIGKPFAWAI